MITNNIATVKITEKNLDHFYNLGYDVYLGESIEVPVVILQDTSHYILKCICDSCGVEKDVTYKNYIKYKNEKFGDYNCRKCSDKKRVKTLNKNHGVDSPLQKKEFLEKKIKTEKENLK